MKENKFKVGNYVTNITDFIIGNGIKRTEYRGVIDKINHPFVWIKLTNGDIFCDYFYVFDFDIEKYREDRLNKLLM